MMAWGHSQYMNLITIVHKYVITTCTQGIFCNLKFLDKDECLSNNGGCAHNCTNYNGTYGCSCATGYTLSANGKSCTG